MKRVNRIVWLDKKGDELIAETGDGKFHLPSCYFLTTDKLLELASAIADALKTIKPSPRSNKKTP